MGYVMKLCYSLPVVTNDSNYIDPRSFGSDTAAGSHFMVIGVNSEGAFWAGSVHNGWGRWDVTGAR